MGNVSAKEGENGHMATSPEQVAGACGGSSSVETAAARPLPLSPPDAVMLEQPPPVPYLFASQVPVTPLQRPTEFSPVFNHSPINGSDEPNNRNSQEKGIPTLIIWSQGGNEVFLEGSWDNWTSRRALERSGKDHTILLVLPSGVYHYRIIVDGELRYVPELPHVTDERGQVTNLLDVHDYVPENLDSVAEFEAPPSPEHSYYLQYPGDKEYAKEPPTLPPQLLMSVLGDTHNTDEQTPKPQHVVLNHLFIEKGWGSQSLLALGVTHRFESKYVSVVLYKPLRR
uniref:Association with the SNF1 complex (ASC) domain-containing protein n=1 Tax=Arundo donax TaxID=35708 RepID=A0A0A9GVU2_ARUDO